MLVKAAWLLLIAAASADVYMHTLRGSNNRLDEGDGNANNQNRLFDSQNNAAASSALARSKPVCTHTHPAARC